MKFKLSLLNLILQLHDVGKEGLKKEQGKGGGKPSKMSEEQFKKLEKILREEKERKKKKYQKIK